MFTFSWEPHYEKFLSSELKIQSNVTSKNTANIENGLSNLPTNNISSSDNNYELNFDEVNGIRLESIDTIGTIFSNWYRVYVEISPKLSSTYPLRNDNRTGRESCWEHRKQQILSRLNGFIQKRKSLTLHMIMIIYEEKNVQDLDFSIMEHYDLKIYAQSENIFFNTVHRNNILELNFLQDNTYKIL